MENLALIESFKFKDEKLIDRIFMVILEEGFRNTLKIWLRRKFRHHH